MTIASSFRSTLVTVPDLRGSAAGSFCGAHRCLLGCVSRSASRLYDVLAPEDSLVDSLATFVRQLATGSRTQKFGEPFALAQA